MSDTSNKYVKLSSAAIISEQQELLKLYADNIKYYGLEEYHNQIFESLGPPTIKEIETHKALYQKEKKISNKEDTIHGDPMSSDLASTLVRNIKYRDDGHVIFSGGFEEWKLVSRHIHFTIRDKVFKIIYSLGIRYHMLEYYKMNILQSDKEFYDRYLSEQKAHDVGRYMDSNSWSIHVMSKTEEKEGLTPQVTLDEEHSNHHYGYHYKAYIKSDWKEKVFDYGFQTTDIAGKVVMVLDAMERKPGSFVQNLDLPDVELFDIKVGYAIIPQDSNVWQIARQPDVDGVSALDTHKRATVYNKDLVLSRIKNTDGSYTLATGKDAEWSQRTLKMRVKRQMLKQMGAV